MQQPLLKISGLKVRYRDRLVQALAEIDLEIRRGETVALVGDSGSGKSTLATAILRLLPPDAEVTAGQIWLDETDLLQLPERQMRSYRGRRIGLVLQESLSALNPVLRIGSQVAEVIRHHFRTPRREARDRALGLLQRVQLADAVALYDCFPHQLSGGQRQRVAIAIALAGEPELLIADEPTTALDAWLQQEILGLLRHLQQERRLAMLLISHDLALVAHFADRVAVVHEGRIVETGAVGQLFRRPQHVHTRRLLSAIPRLPVSEMHP